MELVTNPLLASHFTWDSCQLSKFNGSEWVRFIHEPWTADRLWDVQVINIQSTELGSHSVSNTRTNFQKMESHFHLFSMRTKQNYRHLGPQRVILSLLGLEIFHQIYGMERASGVVKLLGGYQLYSSISLFHVIHNLCSIL